MKIRYILLALGLAAVAAGCQKNFDDQSAQTPVGKTETITIRAVKSVDTKTEFWEDEENVYHTAWEAGDRISVYEFVVGKTDAPELYDLDGECGPIESDPLSEGGEVASFSVTMDSYYWDTTMTEEEQIALLSTNGMLVKRPLIIGEDFVLVGFKEAEWDRLK